MNGIGMYPLQEFIFKKENTQELLQLLKIHDVNESDKHGNTPLHLAVMLGKKDFVEMLLSHGASVRLKNIAGWSPVAESISYGSRRMIIAIHRALRNEVAHIVEDKRKILIEAFENMDDFYMEIKWDFYSWIPMITKYLPSDICKFYKKGTCIRIDTTLVEFKNFKWQRGNISLLFDGAAPSSDVLYVVDNVKGVYAKVQSTNNENVSEIENEVVDDMMSCDVKTMQMSTKTINFTQLQTGWFSKEQKQDVIGDYKAKCYRVNGIVLESLKRREHLTTEDIIRNKAVVENISQGVLFENPFDIRCRRESLSPPQKCHVTWEEYLDCEPGLYPVLGRPLILKKTLTPLKATIAMSEDFPLTVDFLLKLLEVVAPFKHYKKLRDFLKMKLPPGFPVKIDIPIFHTLSAKVTFQDYKCGHDKPDSFFRVPWDYFEDSKCFSMEKAS